MSAAHAEGPHATNAGAVNRTETTPSPTTRVIAPEHPSPKRYRLSVEASAALTRWWAELVDGRMSIAQLPLEILAFVVMGETSAEQRLLPRIKQSQRDADRLWSAAFGPKIPPTPDVPFAELLRRRGQHDDAERYEAFVAKLMGDADE